MKPVQVTAHVDKNGKLELDELPTLPPGEDLRVLIMEAASISALGKMVDLLAEMEITDPALLAELEALDDALWDMQFASSPDVLKKLADEAIKEHKEGKTVALDPDELNQKLRLR